MSNSKLVNYTKISPNRNSPRNQGIYIISPHCVVGQVTVERLGEIFASADRDASSNYGIGYDGKVGMYVEEKDRSWCTSSAWNDNRAVTIEVASDTYHPYAITDAAYDTLVDLMVDICERNGKTKILWFGDKEKTLSYSPKSNEMLITVHRWFDNKACPGEYIYSRLGKIAEEVNKRLAGASKPDPVIGFVRVAGNDRYNTSKGTINRGAPNANAYTLVSGEDFADALSAAYFARSNNAPLLLTSPAMVDDTVKYIKGRSIDKAYIVGGEGVIPKTIEEKLGIPTERICGDTRYHTNLELLKRGKGNEELIIASGKTFPDGMCAGMVDKPVMLVGEFLSYEQLRLIEGRYFHFYIVGGAGVVSNVVANQLSEFGPVERIAGRNRYETALAVANKFYPVTKAVALASGLAFPDGLCASNLGSMPLLLVNNGVTTEARQYISKQGLTDCYVIGGKGVVSDETAEWALTKL